MTTVRENVLLIDADVLCHQFAYSNTTTIDWDGDGETMEFTNPENSKKAVDRFVEGLMKTLKGTAAVLVLSDSNRNFRKELDPTYKLDRAAKPKPTLWKTIRDYIEFGQMEYLVVQYPSLEGDDVLGILATGIYAGISTIVTIDKDLHTIPGRLYLQNHPELGVKQIDELEAIRFHLTQVLTGDAVDCYPGLKGCGPITAAKLLNDVHDPEELWAVVVAEYVRKGKTEDDAIHQARLAYILQDGDYDFETNEVRLWCPGNLSLV